VEGSGAVGIALNVVCAASIVNVSNLIASNLIAQKNMNLSFVRVGGCMSAPTFAAQEKKITNPCFFP
jgi:hypothetical protein